MSIHPQVKWAQRKASVYITVDIPDCQDLVVDLQEESLHFKGRSNNQDYEFTLEFFDKIDKEKSKYIASRVVSFLLNKQEAKRWSSLCKDSNKMNWLKCDWDRWLDTDEEEEAGNKNPGYGGDMDFGDLGDMDMSKMMGGMGGDMGGDMDGLDNEEMSGEESASSEEGVETGQSATSAPPETPSESSPKDLIENQTQKNIEKDLSTTNETNKTEESSCTSAQKKD